MLRSLVDYYEYLLDNEVEGVARPGWSSVPVGALAEVDGAGNLVGIIPAEDKAGWKRQVPQRVERSSGVSANLLCDTSSYLFGVDAKGKPDRAVKCFNDAKEKNTALLEGVDSPAARAVLAFFSRWEPSQAPDHPVIASNKEVVLSGRNIAFYFKGKEVLEDDEVVAAVNRAAQRSNTGAAAEMRCLVTGERAPVARLHPKIKGVLGAQSSGASLVSFNAAAFESYGCEEAQGFNAPVSEYAAFAYTTALNYLLSDPMHRVRIGDTTVVFWSVENDREAASVFREGIDPGFTLRLPGAGDSPKKNPEQQARDADASLDATMASIAKGRTSDGVSLDVPFFVLGLDPNAARVSVRFFLQDSLGAFMANIAEHYKRLAIAHGPQQSNYLSPYRLVMETQNSNAKRGDAASILAGALLRSILTDAPYPAALYQNALLRVRATQDNDEKKIRKVSYGRAAIMKAVLIKNYGVSEEVLTVDLNEDNASVPYLLGRLFSELEQTQADAAYLDRRKLNATIVNRYFNAACATPAVAFPEIMKLNMKHLDKLSRTAKGSRHARTIGELTEAIRAQTPSFPARLTIEEQGDFIIGYWCQRQSGFAANNESNHSGEEE